MGLQLGEGAAKLEQKLNVVRFSIRSHGRKVTSWVELSCVTAWPPTKFFPHGWWVPSSAVHPGRTVQQLVEKLVQSVILRSGRRRKNLVLSAVSRRDSALRSE